MTRQKTTRAPKPVQHHPFVDSGYTTGGVHPARICATCDMPEPFRAHQLPDTPPEAQALDERKTGDR